MDKLLIDADPIIYRAGFAAESNEYHIVYVHNADAPSFMPEMIVLSEDPRPWKKQLKLDGGEVIEQEKKVFPLSKADALQMAKTTLAGITNRYPDHEAVLLLSGSDNFRFDVATVKGYKANRKDVPKPVHYGAIREYLIGAHGASESSNCEADDVVSILARQHPRSVIATIDKDLDQIPGLHWDYAKHVEYNVGEIEAMEMFYTQILSGDTTDNIPGLPGVATKTAEGHMVRFSAALELIEDAGDIAGHDYIEFAGSYYWNCVLEMYEDNWTNESIGYVDAALEMARLVKLQEYPGQMWSPPLDLA